MIKFCFYVLKACPLVFKSFSTVVPFNIECKNDLQQEVSQPVDSSLIEVTAAETQTSLPGTPRKQGVHNRKVGTDSSESEDLEEGKERKFSGERYKKSLRLSSEQLVSNILFSQIIMLCNNSWQFVFIT